VVPIDGDEVLKVIEGAARVLTVKVADAKSPPGFPVAVIVYVPGLTEATVKLPVNVPLDVEQVKAVTTLPDSEHDESLVKKSDPDT